ncbi:hypothetical protein OESDEN_12040 [Oesophagostomum dentatum]|uniref:Uncharacterized protein n=1 Tax=Oesophagostomum dentatum TaxID=61180 RepID=A0A0B1STB8_OESDE|nr:hypothetical protein OESDEN_12040 [Oesophagostomum dentatum]
MLNPVDERIKKIVVVGLSEPKEDLKCLFIGDLYNFGKSAEKYQDEAEFIHVLGYDFFGTKQATTSGGLWAYGYTDFPKAPDAGKINASYDRFVEDLKKMKFVDTSSPSFTDDAIAAINMMPEKDDRINCLVFFSAQRYTASLPHIYPKNKGIKRIVAVGYDEPKKNLKCLFIGDLYNFGKDKDKYLDEAEFINSVGYDFLGLTEVNSTAGLWAYGYTTFPASPDLSKFTGNYDKFLEELEKMQFTDVTDAMTTTRAIGVLNNLPDGDSRVNCLVFFSAQKDTKYLPVLNPRNKQITTIVGVGFDNTDLSTVVGSRGVAVSVPYYYKDTDVANVIKAILGTYKTTPKPTTSTRRTTTRPKTTTPKPLENLKCLFVGDLYNFGKDADKYADVGVQFLFYRATTTYGMAYNDQEYKDRKAHIN